jgi:hypothetical protein
MIEDKIPEIVEEFTMEVKRADGSSQTSAYKSDKPLPEPGQADKIDALAKEVLKWTGYR